MDSFGPNVKKLFSKFLAREAIPTGGGLANGIAFFVNAEVRKLIMDKAKNDTLTAIRAIKSAPDNPYGDDDEVIAGVILEKIAQKERKIK